MSLRDFISSFTLLIIFSSQLFSQSGWTRQNEFAIRGELNDIVQFNMRKVITVGEFGQIYISENKGNLFKAVKVTDDITFKSLSFINEHTGYVCGENGTIIKTTNGGYNWTFLNSGTRKLLYDIHAINDHTCFAVGENGIILKTTNGGTNWIQKNYNKNYYLISVDFHNLIGIATGSRGIILRTTDYGENWVEINTGINFRGQIMDVDLKNNLGIACGDSMLILKSLNSGLNWIKIDSTYTSIRTLYKAQILDSQNIVIVGDVFAASTNGGNSFYSRPYSLFWPSKSLSLSKIDSGFICGRGMIARTMYYIYSLYYIILPYSIYNLTSLSVIDENNCWVLGPGKFAYQIPVIFNTSDGGNNWVFNEIRHPPFIVNSIRFINEATGYISADRITGAMLMKTTDGGRKWDAVFADSVTYLQFYGDLKYYSNRLYINSSQGIKYTTNDGITWINVPIPGPSIYAIIDTATYYCATGAYTNNLLKSTNSGINWIALSHNYTHGAQWKGVDFIDHNTGYFVGVSRIMKTTNGSSVFSLYTGGSGDEVYNSVEAIDTDYVYIIGQAGIIYKSSNGGYTWKLQYSGVTSDLQQISFINSETGWIVGNNGVILHTTSGGSQWFTNINIPSEFYLYQNYPNPFNSSTKVRYKIPFNGIVNVTVYDVTGRKVKSIIDAFQSGGEYEITFFAENISSGCYFIVLSLDNKYKLSRKTVFLK